MTTLVELAVKHASGELSDDDVRVQSRGVTPVTLVREGDDSWYEGNFQNTVIAVELLIGKSLTREEVTKFFAAIS